jgi:transcriptional regulator with XRE-family HTH domain
MFLLLFLVQWPILRATLSIWTTLFSNKGRYVTFSARVDNLLKTKNLSRKWLAAETGLSYDTISGWSSKGRVPRLDEAEKIARSLNVSIDYLQTGRVLEMEDDPEVIAIMEGLRQASRDDLMRVEGLLMAMGLYKPRPEKEATTVRREQREGGRAAV